MKLYILICIFLVGEAFAAVENGTANTTSVAVVNTTSVEASNQTVADNKNAVNDASNKTQDDSLLVKEGSEGNTQNKNNTNDKPEQKNEDEKRYIVVPIVVKIETSETGIIGKAFEWDAFWSHWNRPKSSDSSGSSRNHEKHHGDRWGSGKPQVSNEWKRIDENLPRKESNEGIPWWNVGSKDVSRKDWSDGKHRSSNFPNNGANQGHDANSGWGGGFGGGLGGGFGGGLGGGLEGGIGDGITLRFA